MGERKVLNKYFPPDFDPSLVPRRKRPKNEQIEVRMMLPFSLQCSTCGEYMYRGKKFNSRKEDVEDETYHGIRIFRFYIKCIVCSNEITFKTDPKHGDYVAEHGCVRNFEPWREADAAEDAAHEERVDEERGDAMKALENRTLDSKREMDILDALDEIKAINQRHAKVDTDALLAHHAALRQQEQAGDSATDAPTAAEPTAEELAKQLDDDKRAAQQAFAQHKEQLMLKSGGDTDKQRPSVFVPAREASKALTAATTAPPSKPLAVVVVKKRKVATTHKPKAKAKRKEPVSVVVTSLVAQYSDSDSD